MLHKVQPKCVHKRRTWDNGLLLVQHLLTLSFYPLSKQSNGYSQHLKQAVNVNVSLWFAVTREGGPSVEQNEAPSSTEGSRWAGIGWEFGLSSQRDRTRHKKRGKEKNRPLTSGSYVAECFPGILNVNTRICCIQRCEWQRRVVTQSLFVGFDFVPTTVTFVADTTPGGHHATAHSARSHSARCPEEKKPQQTLRKPHLIITSTTHLPSKSATDRSTLFCSFRPFPVG